MTNRHIRIQKEIYDWFDFYSRDSEDDIDSYKSMIEQDAYIDAYNNMDYDTIFTEHGLPTDTEVYSDEYGVTVDLMHRYYIEENYGIDALDNVNSALTDAYFSLYYDKLYEYTERVSKELFSNQDENEEVI